MAWHDCVVQTLSLRAPSAPCSGRALLIEVETDAEAAVERAGIAVVAKRSRRGHAGARTVTGVALGAGTVQAVPAGSGPLPSVHGQSEAFSKWRHASPGLQESAVQGLLSSQLRLPVETHAPAWQRSPVVQTFESVHAVPLGWFVC
jgi:hypothetical protein